MDSCVQFLETMKIYRCEKNYYFPNASSLANAWSYFFNHNDSCREFHIFLLASYKLYIFVFNYLEKVYLSNISGNRKVIFFFYQFIDKFICLVLTFIVSEVTLERVLLTMKIVKTIDNDFLAYNLIVYIKNILLVSLAECKSWINLTPLNHS